MHKSLLILSGVIVNSKIFVDTAPLIYFLEKSESYYQKVRDYLFENYTKDSQFVTSVITKMEFSVISLKQNKKIQIEYFNQFLESLSFDVNIINDETAGTAAMLRSHYSFLSGMDALQIACCINNKCDVFLTNDRQLTKVKEINTVLISNL